VFAVAISQRVVYIPWFQLGEPQLELTCNTSSSLSPCSPQSLSTPLETSPESQVINSNTRTPLQPQLLVTSPSHCVCVFTPSSSLASSTHQSAAPSPCRWTPTTCDAGGTLGHHQHGLHLRTSRVRGLWCYYVHFLRYRQTRRRLQSSVKASWNPLRSWRAYYNKAI